MIIIKYGSVDSQKYLLEKGAQIRSRQNINGKILTGYDLPGCRVNTFETPNNSHERDADLDRIIFKGEREQQEATVFAHVFSDELCGIKNASNLPKAGKPAKPQ